LTPISKSFLTCATWHRSMPSTPTTWDKDITQPSCR